MLVRSSSTRPRRWLRLLGATLGISSLLYAMPLHAQGTASVRGVVVAAGSGEPLAGVALRLEGSGRTVSSDAGGRFAFERVPAGSWTLQATRVGYASAST